jgi:hypothetical protein
VYQCRICWLRRRFREQARSHIFDPVTLAFLLLGGLPG